jgi:hypothetical protein
VRRSGLAWFWAVSFALAPLAGETSRVGKVAARSSSRRKRSSRLAHSSVTWPTRLVLSRVQLISDCHKVYREAVEGAFGPNIDCAMPMKMYGGNRGKDGTAERRYSPAVCTELREQTITVALDNLTRFAAPG